MQSLSLVTQQTSLVL